jgi:hypothetical protein
LVVDVGIGYRKPPAEDLAEQAKEMQAVSSVSYFSSERLVDFVTTFRGKNIEGRTPDSEVDRQAEIMRKTFLENPGYDALSS